MTEPERLIHPDDNDINDNYTFPPKTQISESHNLKSNHRKSSVIQDLKPLKPKSCTKKIICIAIALLIIFLILILVHSSYARNQIKDTFVRFVEFASNLEKNNKIAFIIFFFSGHILYNLVFIPGHTYFSILMAFQLKDFVLSFTILIVSYYCAILGGYLITLKIQKNWILSKISDDYRFKIIQNSAKESPKMTSLMVWSVQMPETIKIVVQTLSDISFCDYILPSIPAYIVQSGLYAFIGTGLEKLASPDKKESRSFWELSGVEQFEFVASIMFVVLTIVIFSVFGWIIRKKLKEYKEMMDKSKKGEEFWCSNRQRSFVEEVIINEKNNEMNIEMVPISQKGA